MATLEPIRAPLIRWYFSNPPTIENSKSMFRRPSAPTATFGWQRGWYDEEEFPESVSKAFEILENAGVTTEKRREHADPAEAILDVAEEIDADRIIMAGRKRTPVGKVLFGSVTQSVLLNSAIPVTVVAM